MRPLDFKPELFKLVKTQKYQVYYEDKRQALFIDIPKCRAIRGFHRSKFGRDSPQGPQLSLLLDMDIQEHQDFYSFATKLEDAIRRDVPRIAPCPILKPSGRTENSYLLYSQVDAAAMKGDKVEITARLENFSDGVPVGKDFMMSGSMSVHICSRNCPNEANSVCSL